MDFEDLIAGITRSVSPSVSIQPPIRYSNLLDTSAAVSPTGQMIAGNDLRATVPPIIILLRSHERRITLFTSKLEVPYRNRKALISPSYPPMDSGVMVWGGLFGALHH